MTRTLRKCPGCGFARTLCEEHELCEACDEICNPIPKQRKVTCVGTCGAKLTWRRGKELKCKKCGMVYLEGTKTRDGWRPIHLPVDFQEIRTLEKELAGIKGKKLSAKQEQRRMELQEEIDNRKEKAEYIDVIEGPDGTEYLINYHEPSSGTMRADLTVWPLRGESPIVYLTRCARFEAGSTGTRRMIMAAKKSNKKKSTSAGRNSSLKGMYVFKTVADNPYRESSHLHETFKKINDGMTVEKVKELTDGRPIEFHTMFNHGYIVVADKKTKPSGPAIAKMRDAQKGGVTGKARNHLRDPNKPKAKPKAAKKVSKKKAAKKVAKKKATKAKKGAKKAKAEKSAEVF